MFGGMSAPPSANDGDDSGEASNDMWRFELVSSTYGYWLPLATGPGDRPSPRTDHLLVHMPGNVVFLTGGCDSRKVQADSWTYNYALDRWARFGVASGATDDIDEGGSSAVQPPEPSGDAGNSTSFAERPPPVHVGDGKRADTSLVPETRCASAGARYGTEVVLFGGRMSVDVDAGGDSNAAAEMWSSLGDVWIGRPFATERGRAQLLEAGDNVTLDEEEEDTPSEADDESGPTFWRVLSTTEAAPEPSSQSREDLLLNRSDHAALIHGDDLYVFGEPWRGRWNPSSGAPQMASSSFHAPPPPPPLQAACTRISRSRQSTS